MSINSNNDLLNEILSTIDDLPTSKEEQEKSITIIENGTTEVTSDEGKTLSKVIVNVEVEQSGGLTDWDDNSPIIASGTNSNNTYWELTEKGTLMWKLTNPEKSGKAIFSSGSDLHQIPLNYKAIMSKIKQVYISDGITNANIAWAIKCERIRLPDSLVGAPTLVSGISVKELDISNENYVKLSDYIYNNANALEKIKLSPNITTINRNAFFNCYSLKEIDLKNILTFKILCFSNCAALDKDIVFNPNLISIESQAFAVSGIKSVKFQNSVDSLPTIANNAFSLCRELTDIYCPWAEGAVANAPWGATNATIHYNTTFDENGNPIAAEV